MSTLGNEALSRLRSHFAAHIDVAKFDKNSAQEQGARNLLEDLDTLVYCLSVVDQAKTTDSDRITVLRELREQTGKSGDYWDYDSFTHLINAFEAAQEEDQHDH